jgi:type II secretory pathway pseudopilin PulG
MRRSLGNRGDTIVEVLVAIAVASAVLGSAYLIVNRTLANSQQAQEHSEALGIAQGQVEQLQARSSAGNTDIYNPGNNQHCFDGSGTLQDITPKLKALPSDVDSDSSKYPSGCSGLGSQGFYRTAFEYDSKANSFTVYVDWPSATGHGDDHVSLSYRPYKP